LVVGVLLFAVAARADSSCTTTTFSPSGPFVPPGTTHQAMALLDPAGQQRAVFDLAWGGALASLKWNGVEYAYGNAIGAMVQPALHHGNPDWNPTLAGANGGPGSPATGVRCLDSNTLQIQTTMLDFNSVDGPPSAYQAVLNGVLVAGKWSTPYVMVTTASF